MSDKVYTVADIARITGYNRSTVTRWMTKHKVKNAQMRGNAPLYSAQVLERFKKAHNNKDTKPDLKDALVHEKDARIKALSDEVEFLKSQLVIKDQQIDTANRLADQAQKLNLADKPQLMHKKDAETDSEKADSAEKPDNQSKKNARKHWYDWIFRRSKE